MAFLFYWGSLSAMHDVELVEIGVKNQLAVAKSIPRYLIVYILSTGAVDDKRNMNMP